MEKEEATTTPPGRNTPFDRKVNLTDFATLRANCSDATQRTAALNNYSTDNIATVLYAAMWQDVFGTGFPLASGNTVGVNLVWYVEDGGLKLAPLPFDEEGKPSGGEEYEAPSPGAVRNWLENTTSVTVATFSASEVATWLGIEGTVPTASATFVLILLDAADAEGLPRFTLGIELNSTEAAWGRPCPPFCYPNVLLG